MTENTAKPASLIDLAFDTGRIAERDRIVRLIETNYPHNEEPFCMKCDLIDAIRSESNGPGCHEKAAEPSKAPEPEAEHTAECSDPGCFGCEYACDICEGDGWVYKRIDVDAEKRVPCDCGIGAPD